MLLRVEREREPSIGRDFWSSSIALATPALADTAALSTEAEMRLTALPEARRCETVRCGGAESTSTERIKTASWLGGLDALG